MERKSGQTVTVTDAMPVITTSPMTKTSTYAEIVTNTSVPRKTQEVYQKQVDEILKRIDILQKQKIEPTTRDIHKLQSKITNLDDEIHKLNSRLELLLLSEDGDQNKTKTKTKIERDLSCYKLLLEYHQAKEEYMKKTTSFMNTTNKLSEGEKYDREALLEKLSKTASNVEKKLEAEVKQLVFETNCDQQKKQQTELFQIQHKLEWVIKDYENEFDLLEKIFRAEIAKIHSDKTEERKTLRESFQRKKQDTKVMRLERIEKLEWLKRELQIQRLYIVRDEINVPNIKGEPNYLYINIPNSSKLYQVRMDYAMKASRYIADLVNNNNKKDNNAITMKVSEKTIPFIIQYITDMYKESYVTNIPLIKSTLEHVALKWHRAYGLRRFYTEMTFDATICQLPYLAEAAHACLQSINHDEIKDMVIQ